MKRQNLSGGLRRLARGLAVTGIALATVAGGALLGAPAATAAPSAIISLTFDDGTNDQIAAAKILNDRGLPGTFYVPSAFINQPGYFSKGDMENLRAAGNEIGGHTTNHLDLSTLSKGEAVRQVCLDRKTFSDMGFTVTSFAYPFAGFNQTARQAVSECGYNSGRGLGDLKSKAGCANCAPAETVPAEDPMWLRAPAQVESNWRLSDLTALVDNAKKGSGWVPITFHRVCAAGCSTIGVTPELLTQFADYLASEVKAGKIIVHTVDQVVGGNAKPVRQNDWDPGQSAIAGNRVLNPGFENWTKGTPDCWELRGWGENRVNARETRLEISGRRSAKVTVSRYVSGATAYMQRHDLGECAPAAEPGKQYVISSRYKANTSVNYVVHLRNAQGTWEYWTESPSFARTHRAKVATWTTPPVPAGYTGISVGTSLSSRGEMVVDDYSLTVVPGGAAPRAVAAEAPSLPTPAEAKATPFTAVPPISETSVVVEQ